VSGLVSVLLPTCNRPHYLLQALESALRQTYAGLEVIICDNSRDEETKRAVEPYLARDSRIRYVQNEANIGYVGTMQRCMKLATGEYISFLMDDDLYRADRLSCMVPILESRPDVTIVTSRRAFIDGHGHAVGMSHSLSDKQAVFDGRAFINLMLTQFVNFVGEPTTALFRKKDLHDGIGLYGGRQYSAIIDMAIWIPLLLKGNCAYLPQLLSSFRQHERQEQKQPEQLAANILEWHSIILQAHRDGCLQQDGQLGTSLLVYLRTCARTVLDLYGLGQAALLKTGEIESILHESIDEAVYGRGIGA
jgi:hypothetical protein